MQHLCRVTILKTAQIIPKFSLNFPDEIAGNVSNKCTFINPNSQRTSRMKKELQYE